MLSLAAAGVVIPSLATATVPTPTTTHTHAGPKVVSTADVIAPTMTTTNVPAPSCNSGMPTIATSVPDVVLPAVPIQTPGTMQVLPQYPAPDPNNHNVSAKASSKMRVGPKRNGQ